MVLPVTHLTLSGAQAEHSTNWSISGFSRRRSAIIHWTVRCAPDMSGEPTEQQSTPRNGRLWWTVKAHSAQVRSQSCEVRTHQTCLVRHQTVRCHKRTTDFNGQLLQTPTVCLRDSRRTVNSTLSGAPPDCPVCPSSAMAGYSGWGYKYPQPPPFKLSKSPTLQIQYKSKGKHSKDTTKAFNPLQAPKSTQFLRDLREDHLCSFVARVAWIAFFFSFLFF
jgi:hypothetical protein